MSGSKKDIYIYGYFGYNNLGDDLIMIVENAIFSKYFNIKFVANVKKNNYLNKFEIIGLLKYLFRRKKSNILVIGGGGLFPKDNYRTMAKYLLIKVFAKCYFLYGVGVDPILKYKSLIKKLFIKSKFNIFRDTQSYKNVEASPNNSLVGVDVVACFWEMINEELSLEKSTCNQSYDYAVILRGTKKKVESEYYLKLVEKLLKHGKKVVCIPFREPEDRETALFIKKVYPSIKISENKIEEKLCNIKNSSTIISQRYHGVILSLLYNKKFVPIIYDYKFEYLLDEIKWSMPRFYFSTDLKIHLKEKKVSSVDEVYDFIQKLEKVDFEEYHKNFNELIKISRRNYLRILSKIISNNNENEVKR